MEAGGAGFRESIFLSHLVRRQAGHPASRASAFAKATADRHSGGANSASPLRATRSGSPPSLPPMAGLCDSPVAGCLLRNFNQIHGVVRNMFG